MTKLKGGCLCGAIRYSCSADPIFTFACHCRFCQRSSGTAFRAAMSFKNSDVEFSGSELKQYTYQSEEHGREVYVQFCPECSTQVTATTERAPKGRIIMIGTLDEPDQIDVKTHMFAYESFHWVSVSDDDIVYAKHRLNEDGSAAEPL